MENAALMEWAEPTAAEQRRRFRTTVLLSLCAHLLLLASVYVVPAPKPRALPPAITIDLLAALPDAPAPAPKAAAKPAPKPAPAQPAPAPAQKVKILPKQAPAAEARPRVEPKPEPVQRRAKPKEMKYDDALASLREQLGEEAPPSQEELEAERAEKAAFDELLAQTRAQSQGVKVDAEIARWYIAVKRHLRATWITPPEFRQPGLMTELNVQLAADGRVLGVPEVVRSSGNPPYDDNTVRAVQKASPLPAPPKPGLYAIVFTPEE